MVVKATSEPEGYDEWTGGTLAPGPSRTSSQIRREFREAAALRLPHCAL